MHRDTVIYPDSALQGLRPVPLHKPARAFTNTQIDTPDYFLSGANLSNPIFHSSEDSHPVILIRCWGTNPVLAAQGTDASF